MTGLAGVDGIERSCLLHSPRGLTRLTFYVERNDKSQLAKKALGVSFSWSAACQHYHCTVRWIGESNARSLINGLYFHPYLSPKKVSKCLYLPVLSPTMYNLTSLPQRYPTSDQMTAHSPHKAQQPHLIRINLKLFISMQTRHRVHPVLPFACCWSRNTTADHTFLLLCWTQHLKWAHESFVNGHHSPRIVKFSTVIRRTEHRHQLPSRKELISIFHHLMRSYNEIKVLRISHQIQTSNSRYELTCFRLNFSTMSAPKVNDTPRSLSALHTCESSFQTITQSTIHGYWDQDLPREHRKASQCLERRLDAKCGEFAPCCSNRATILHVCKKSYHQPKDSSKPWCTRWKQRKNTIAAIGRQLKTWQATVRLDSINSKIHPPYWMLSKASSCSGAYIRHRIWNGVKFIWWCDISYP